MEGFYKYFKFIKQPGLAEADFCETGLLTQVLKKQGSFDVPTLPSIFNFIGLVSMAVTLTSVSS